MPDEYLGQNITDVDTGEGETPRSFCWRGETHQVAETLLVSHVYGVGQAREGRLWMPRARATTTPCAPAAARFWSWCANG